MTTVPLKSTAEGERTTSVCKLEQYTTDSHSTRFVEFIGLPGVGKSTIARELVALMRSKNCPVVASTDLTKDDAAFLLRAYYRIKLIVSALRSNVRIYYRIAANVSAQRQHTVLDLMKVTYNFWTVVAMLTAYRRDHRGLVVVDQGLAQAIWSVHLTGSKTKEMKAWNSVIDAIGLRDIHFVVLEADRNVVKARLGERRKITSRMQGSSCGDDAWHEAEEIRKCLLGTMQEWLGTPPESGSKRDRLIVLSTDGQREPGQIATEIDKLFLLVDQDGASINSQPSVVRERNHTEGSRD